VAKEQLSVRLIDVAAWNQARWLGVGFFQSASPIMALIFKNESAARTIFNGWKRRVGDDDTYDQIRIAIIEGKLPGIADGYAVHINADVQAVLDREKANGNTIKPETIYTLGRVHHIERGSPGLAYFKQAQARAGDYVLMPAIPQGGSENPPRLLEELGIKKHQLIVKRAEDVTRTDFDWVAVERPK
jgi:hypothetical protein